MVRAAQARGQALSGPGGSRTRNLRLLRALPLPVRLPALQWERMESNHLGSEPTTGLQPGALPFGHTPIGQGSCYRLPAFAQTFIHCLPLCKRPSQTQLSSTPERSRTSNLLILNQTPASNWATGAYSVVGVMAPRPGARRDNTTGAEGSQGRAGDAVLNSRWCSLVSCRSL